MKKFIFGVTLALAVLLAVPLTASADNSINFTGYCASKGLGEPYSAGRDWYCRGSNFSLSLDEVCRNLHGNGFRAVSANVLDPNSWVCEEPLNTRPSFSHGRLGDHQSGLDIYRFCISTGRGEPYTQGRDWYCRDSNFNVSMDEVCRWQNGEFSRAKSDDFMNPFAWRCEK